MDWLQAVSQLGLTGVLAYIVQKLWAKCEAQQTEIAKLNSDRLQDLRSMLKPED